MKLKHKLTMMTSDAEITAEHMEAEYKGKAIVIFSGIVVPVNHWKEYEIISVTDDEQQKLAAAGYAA